MNKNQSPVATVTIYNYILTRGERQRLEATLDFPCENHILAETLAALQIEGDGEHGEVEVVWRQDLLRPLVFGAWDGREVCHIYELNYLTTLLSDLSPDDLVCYTAMVNHLFAGSVLLRLNRIRGGHPMQPKIIPISNGFTLPTDQAAEKEKVFAIIKYEQSLAMLQRIRAEKLITPREFETTKELLHQRFFGCEEHLCA